MKRPEPQAELAFAIVTAALITIFSVFLVFYLGQVGEQFKAVEFEQPLMAQLAAASRWYWLLIALASIGGAFLIWLEKRLEGWLALGISGIVTLAVLGFTIYAAL